MMARRQLMVKPRRHVTLRSTHEIEVRDVMFRQARIIRDLPEKKDELVGILNETYTQSALRDRLQRVVLGKFVFDAVVNLDDGT